jgi:hypothetical protein
MSKDAVFLDIEKAFDTTWHLGLLHKLSSLKFSISLIKLIRSSLSQRKFGASVGGEMSTPKEYKSKSATGFRPVPHIVQYLYK